MSGNKATDVKVGGSVTQRTDSDAGNTVERAEIDKSLKQGQESKDGFRYFGIKARGKVAIGAVVVIFIAYYIYRYLSSH